ncbi:heteromeric transposase endonuclease subunit TnsA [Anoxybacillus sp. PDR2]|uniref:TnsA endonuclease N-terminal domain-containing protein n=1 Tax=Anoxybacillus sp. PDR2 TaxID=1636720 RepID=UPI00131842E0|nr:TnsA endonuclease N-terminal domain-containing protein [Anoxybacillus sp. PDR2]QHC05374.1 heteromeric transposase endonuclease subunit TnsA [Anoxybacillus sp. PDR2]
MARFQYHWTFERIDKYIKEGRGQGEFENYKPWLTVRDVPSNGRVAREMGTKVKREYHFLSDLERYFFYILEWQDSVVDIREQYPILEMEKTVEIAELLGFAHPKDPKTKINIVMTSDFMITYKNDQGDVCYAARSIKSFKDLLKKRTLEKLLIEKYYYDQLGIDWGVVTDKEINKDFAVNLQDLRQYQLFPFGVDEGVLDVLRHKISRVNPREKVIHTLKKLSEDIGIDEVTLLNALKSLISNKIISVNLTKRLNFNKSWNSLLNGGTK